MEKSMSLNSFDRQLWYREGAKPSLLSLTPTPSLSLSLFHSWRAIEYGDRLFSIGSVLLIVCPDNPCRKLWRHSQERPRVASFPSVEYIISSSPVNLQPLTLEPRVPHWASVVGPGQVMNGTRTPTALWTDTWEKMIPSTYEGGRGVTWHPLWPTRQTTLFNNIPADRSQKPTHPLHSGGLLEDKLLSSSSCKSERK